MCQRAICPKCKKVTWVGCGAHVDAVLRGVPPSDRCQCPRPAKKAASSGWR